ncbi:hypothetical protein RSAG8_12453, partial [Rhizoctonia solani AG-8 WAC10335]
MSVLDITRSLYYIEPRAQISSLHSRSLTTRSTDVHSCRRTFSGGGKRRCRFHRASLLQCWVYIRARVNSYADRSERGTNELVQPRSSAANPIPLLKKGGTWLCILSLI